MEDYSKFKLKNARELSSLLEREDDFYVFACNKCFKEFSAVVEPECGEFLAFSGARGKTALGGETVDFLCNKSRSDCILKSSVTPEVKCIFVIACGLGVQTVAELVDIPVYTLCDSVNSGADHAVSLSQYQCNACGQCFLNDSCGICPVTDCSKGLLNGQCGGSKDGKCEADVNKDCAWDKIYNAQLLSPNAQLLSPNAQPLSPNAQPLSPNAQPLLPNAPSLLPQDSTPHLRDYSKLNHKFIFAHAKNIREKRMESYYGGLYLRGCKDFSVSLALQNFPVPETVVIPMSQHAGMSADPIVRLDDYVMVGQKIGEAVGVFSSSVHSSISGLVTEIAPHRHPNSSHDVVSITIQSDGKDAPHRSIIPIDYWDDLDVYDIDAIIAEKGIVGMGGAGFPTPVKLKAPKPIDTILINGCESEPYITADHRIMLEFADDVLFGLKILLKSTSAKRGIVVIGDNKGDAISNFKAKTAYLDNIDVMAVRAKYPQGAEKMLISRTLGRNLATGMRPYDVGVIVINVSTARAIADAFLRGMPLIERAVTVSGEKIQRPGNFMVRIGTSVKDILTYCGVTDDEITVKLGGPMMGIEITDFDVPVIKGTNGIIATSPKLAEPSECIRCGRCVDVCPMELLPLYFPVYAATENWEAMEDKGIANCVECGCCDYICPSHIAIVKAIKDCKKSHRRAGELVHRIRNPGM